MATTSGQQNAAQMNAQIAMMTNALNQQILNEQSGKAIGALGTGFGQARTDLGTGLPLSLNALGTGYDAARGDVTQGYGQAQDTLRTGIAGFDPYAASGRAATGMIDNALGLGGPGGTQAAQTAFQASPGYAWQRDQAVDAAARKANALGIAGSGNTLDAITRLGSSLANTEYGNWLDRLGQARAAGLTAASGQMGGSTSLAGAQAGEGTALGSLGTGLGTAQAGLYDTNAARLANLGTGLGTASAGVYTGLGNSLMASNNNALNTVANSNTQFGQAQDAATAADRKFMMDAIGLGMRGISALGSFV